LEKQGIVGWAVGKALGMISPKLESCGTFKGSTKAFPFASLAL
jgi:hypothetical protein